MLYLRLINESQHGGDARKKTTEDTLVPTFPNPTEDPLVPERLILGLEKFLAASKRNQMYLNVKV